MDERFQALSEALQQKGYVVSVFATGKEAAAYLDANIDGKTVGMGGSATLSQIGIYEMLASHNTVYWHANKPEHLTVRETRKAATGAEIYLSSVNGISMDGQIVNLDGTGNRVAAISFGPDRVYLVVGKNKLAGDLTAAIDRTRNVASPKNAQRLQCKTPCARNADSCHDCHSEARICRVLTILLEKPMGEAVYEVLLVDEELGF